MGRKFNSNFRPFGVMSNPGASVGRVLGKIGRNYSKLGRYTLDNLTPAGYGNHIKELFAVYTKPLYQKPPSFKNGRKPLWYNRYAKSYGVDAAENRFQNGAIWAQIPEEEIPLTMYVRNSEPNSYRMTEKGVPLDANGNHKYPIEEPGQSADIFTMGNVGGEHSGYMSIVDNLCGESLMGFADEQKLNPQWAWASKLKNKFNIKGESKLGKLVDFFGRANLSGLLGYKPFKIKQLYTVNPDKTIKPIFDDPTKVLNELNVL